MAKKYFDGEGFINAYSGAKVSIARVLSNLYPMEFKFRGKKVKSIEDDKHCLVYAVTHDYMIFGECYSLLLVSPYQEDWNYSLLAEDNSIFRVNAYVWNSTVEEHSEMGYVIIKTIKGNLGRIG